MGVRCTVEEIVMTGDNGRPVAGVRVACGRCDHETESYGTSGRSVRRCLVLLREECPLNQSNYYVTDDDDENVGYDDEFD